MAQHISKKFAVRPSPACHASSCPGLTKRGNDKNLWVSTAVTTGYRWMKKPSKARGVRTTATKRPTKATSDFWMNPKSRVQNWICSRGDMYHRVKLDKNVCVDQIFDLYRHRNPSLSQQELVDQIDNDFLWLVGGELPGGVMQPDESKDLDEAELKQFMKQVPNFYLVAFFGLYFHQGTPQIELTTVRSV